jgi:hypothetical protein
MSAAMFRIYDLNYVQRSEEYENAYEHGPGIR